MLWFKKRKKSSTSEIIHPSILAPSCMSSGYHTSVCKGSSGDGPAAQAGDELESEQSASAAAAGPESSCLVRVSGTSDMLALQSIAAV